MAWDQVSGAAAVGDLRPEIDFRKVLRTISSGSGAPGHIVSLPKILASRLVASLGLRLTI